jgi:hypothetical protein
VLLRAGDRDALLVDADRVGGVLDLGLLVAQLPGDGLPRRLATVRRSRSAGRGQQHDLVEPAGSAHEQHQRAHRLLVSEAALADRVAEHVHAGDDPRERRIGERVALVEAVTAGGLSPASSFRPAA